MKYGEPWTHVQFLALAAPGSAGGHEFVYYAEKRAVACVNACAGLDLPDDVPAGALAELVAAARFAGYGDGTIGPGSLNGQRAALAKLGRGGA